VIIRPVGERALLVEVADARAAVALARLVRDRETTEGLPGPTEVVPAARTVLLDGLSGRGAVQIWRDRLAAVAPDDLLSEHLGPGRTAVVCATYDGVDLAAIAAAWHCSPEAVVQRHQATDFLVAFCGFAPGFAYCLPVEPLPEVPRRDVPRERVPAGSVALGGGYCGIYPRTMPGGWQVIGHTDAVLFDPHRDPPALLAPGDRVRFRSQP
jgi:KipI family sensor histidine kinase inhibitor